MAKQTNPDFLNGVPELVVLQLLSRRPMYGYELLRAIDHSSGEVLEFGEGCIYPILHGWRTDGHLTSRARTRRHEPRGLSDGERMEAARACGGVAERAAINLVLTRAEDASHPSRMNAANAPPGLPRAYIGAVAGGIDDHYEDLRGKEYPMGAARKLRFGRMSRKIEQRLGEPDATARSRLSSMTRSFWGRHPS
jgi:PadR family transcriptional regulator PadR